jgi:hypothetical protein
LLPLRFALATRSKDSVGGAACAAQAKTPKAETPNTVTANDKGRNLECRFNFTETSRDDKLSRETFVQNKSDVWQAECKQNRYQTISVQRHSF